MKILTLTLFACFRAFGQPQTGSTDEAKPAPKTTVCDPYIPKSPCTAEVNFASGEHDIIAVPPGGAATLHVTHITPLSVCQAAYAPGPLTRSADAAIGGVLTALGGLGAVGGGAAKTLEVRSPEDDVKSLRSLVGFTEADSITAQVKTLGAEEIRIASGLPAARKPYEDTSKVLDAFRKLDHEPTEKELQDLRDKLDEIVKKPIPVVSGLQAELDSVGRAIAAFHQKYDVTPDPQSARAVWLATINDAVNLVAGAIARDQDYISDIPTFWTSLKQVQVQIAKAIASHHPRPGEKLEPVLFTSADLKPPKFYNSNVAVTITCKDSVDKTPSQITVTFTAYYTRLPILDLSAGVLFSLAGRHQVGVISATPAQLTANAMAPGSLAVTDSSSFQVVPMAFIEIHSRGFRCPWATPNDRERRFGYVCSAGVAFGAGPNNGSGTTEAEFFEGASFAIQRVSFLFGIHDARVEQFGGGVAVGQSVPQGFMPLITRGWNFKPAFGITYRIPVH